MKTIKTTIKKFAENIRHVSQVAYNDIKHEMHLINDDEYLAAYSSEAVRHQFNLVRIVHPNNPLVKFFGEGLDIVDNTLEFINDHINDNPNNSFVNAFNETLATGGDLIGSIFDKSDE